MTADISLEIIRRPYIENAPQRTDIVIGGRPAGTYYMKGAHGVIWDRVNADGSWDTVEFWYANAWERFRRDVYAAARAEAGDPQAAVIVKRADW